MTVSVAVSAGACARRRPRRGPKLEQPIEQREGLLAPAPGEADAGRVGTGAFLQPDRRKHADRPGDPRPHAKARGGAAQWAPVELRARVTQADVSPDPAHPPVSPSVHDEGGVRPEALAIGVAHTVVPAPQKCTDDRIDATWAVREPLAADQRRELHHADALVRRAMSARLEAHRNDRAQPALITHTHSLTPGKDTPGRLPPAPVDAGIS